MASPPQRSVRNRILSYLSPDDYDLLQPHLEPVQLTLRTTIIEAGQTICHVAFVERGLISLLAQHEEARIEVGMIGPEGFVGVNALLGGDTSPLMSLVQFHCPRCALMRHEPDAVHCKACGNLLAIPNDGG